VTLVVLAISPKGRSSRGDLSVSCANWCARCVWVWCWRRAVPQICQTAKRMTMAPMLRIHANTFFPRRRRRSPRVLPPPSTCPDDSAGSLSFSAPGSSGGACGGGGEGAKGIRSGEGGGACGGRGGAGLLLMRWVTRGRAGEGGADVVTGGTGGGTLSGGATRRGGGGVAVGLGAAPRAPELIVVDLSTISGVPAMVWATRLAARTMRPAARSGEAVPSAEAQIACQSTAGSDAVGSRTLPATTASATRLSLKRRARSTARSDDVYGNGDELRAVPGSVSDIFRVGAHEFHCRWCRVGQRVPCPAPFITGGPTPTEISDGVDQGNGRARARSATVNVLNVPWSCSSSARQKPSTRSADRFVSSRERKLVRN